MSDFYGNERGWYDDPLTVTRSTLFWLGQLALAGLLFSVGWSLRGEQGLQTAANVAQLASLLLGVPPVAVLLWSLRRPSEATRDAVEILAAAVSAQWRTEALIRALDDPDPIPVWWRPTVRAVSDHMENIGPPVSACADDIASLVKGFRALRRPRLVVLGDVGTGKTTLAVLLVRELLATRTATDPVPVLLSAASWDAIAHPNLGSWIAARLRQEYPALGAVEFGPDASSRLVADGRVLPVLDGLDEMRAPARLAALKALNRSLAGEDQLVLTCRTDEYVATVSRAGEVLNSALVIEPDLLTPAAAADFLRRCLPPARDPCWDSVLDSVRVATALDLWLLRAVYVTPGTSPSPLTRFSDTEALRDHLLDGLIPAVVEMRPPTANRQELFRPLHAWDPHDVHRWLGTIACGLADAGTPDFAWWRLARHTGVITRARGIIWGATAGLVAGAVGMVLVGLFIAALVDLRAGVVMAMSTGLIYTVPFGVVSGAVIGANARAWTYQSPGFADFHLKRWQPRRTDGAARWLPGIVALVDLAVGITAGGRLGVAVRGALLVGFTAWLVAQLVTLVETPARTHAAVTPQSTLRADRRLTFVRFVAGAIVLGAGLTGGGPLILPGMFLLGGMLGIAVGRHHAWLAYRLAVGKLASKLLVPRDLMAFLDDAHRLGLLRAVGPLYQFRHVALRDHLVAAGWPPRPTDQQRRQHRSRDGPDPG